MNMREHAVRLYKIVMTFYDGKPTSLDRVEQYLTEHFAPTGSDTCPTCIFCKTELKRYCPKCQKLEKVESAWSLHTDNDKPIKREA